MKITGAIFDMDGTLIDSMYIWDVVGDLYLENRRITPEKDLRSRLRTLSLDQAAAYLKKQYDLPDTLPEIIDGINDTVRKEYETRITLKSGVKEFLQKLSDRGIPMVVATATDYGISKQVLARLGIGHYFSSIFFLLGLEYRER